MVWSEGNMSLKNPVTTPGIDTGTVRLAAQRLNHYATPDPFKTCRFAKRLYNKYIQKADLVGLFKEWVGN